MKNNTLKVSILIALLAFGLQGCKYEEGPAISLRSKNERVANTWVIDKAYEDGKDVTEDYDQFDLFMSQDQNATLTTNYKAGGAVFAFTTEGTWSFENDKEDIRMDFKNDDADNVYSILKLKENEMWLREKGGTTELHFKTK